MKPNFAQLQDSLAPFCNQDNQNQSTKVAVDAQGNLVINARFFVDTSGNIQRISYSPAINNQIQTILEKSLHKIHFYPRNEYGLAKSFSIEQPIIIQCK